MKKPPRQSEISMSASKLLTALEGAGKNPYDPELVYVECKVCGRPILWEPGCTTALLNQSGINPLAVDERYLILSDGCRECNSSADSYNLSIVRFESIPLHSLLLMQKPQGHA